MTPKSFHTAIKNLKSNKQICLVSVATFAIAFSIVGMFLLVFINLNSLLSMWSEQVQLIVYLKDDIQKEDKNYLENVITQNSNISSVQYISRDYAWQSFKNTFSAKSEFLESLDINPLPASYNLTFKPSSGRLQQIRKFAETLRKQNGVESLEFGEKWISRFEKFMFFLRIFLMAIGGFLSLGLIFIVSNTIRLSVLSRQGEIELMLLVGATYRHIKTPYLIEGMIQSAGGALLSLIFMKVLHIYMSYQFKNSIEAIARGAEFQFISLTQIGILLLTSIFVGWIGSYLSIYQYLNSEKL